jgi:hypothetical protein
MGSGVRRKFLEEDRMILCVWCIAQTDVQSVMFRFIQLVKS